MLFIDYFSDSPLPTTNQGADEIPFQRWFHFKEAYAPSLVMSVIEDAGLKKGAHILDPFGGSGTTALTAQLLGYNAQTVEVNPFLADVIKAKTAKYKLQDLLADQLMVIEKSKSYKPNIKETLGHLPETFIEGKNKERWIFNRNIAERISQILQAIDKISCSNNKRLLRVLLGASLLSVSNVYVSGKGRRYRKNWPDIKITKHDLDEILGERIKNAVSDIARFSDMRLNPVKILHGDSRAALNKLEQKFDLVMFSPPYPNSFDYTDVYNVELWTLKYLSNFSQNRNLRENTLRSHVQVKRSMEYEELSSPSLNRAYKKLSKEKESLWDKNIPEMVYAYFSDLEKIYKSIHPKMKKNSRIAAVVGDSQYNGIKIPVAQILEELSEDMGYRLISNEPARSMRTSPQQGGKAQLAESLVIFEKV